MRGKQLQFELWQECGAKCSYCYLGHLNICTPDEEKINTMDFALKSISNLKRFIFSISECLGFGVAMPTECYITVRVVILAIHPNFMPI